MRLCDPINEESLRHQTTQLRFKLQPHRPHYDVIGNSNHIVVLTATFYSFSTGCHMRMISIFKYVVLQIVYTLNQKCIYHLR